MIKATHGQGMNIICKDKTQLDREKTIRTLKKWLRVKYLPCYGEWFYDVIPPRIVVERFLDENGECPKDYKIFVLMGNLSLLMYIWTGLLSIKEIFMIWIGMS